MKRLLASMMFAVVLAVGFAHTASAGQWGRVRAYCQTRVGYGPPTRIPVDYLGTPCRIFIPGFGTSIGRWFEYEG